MGTAQQCASASHNLFHCADHTDVQVLIVVCIAAFALAVLLFQELTIRKETQ